MTDWRPAAVAALAAVLSGGASPGGGGSVSSGGDCDRGPLDGLLEEAVDQLAELLADRPPETVAALAVPVAVHRALTGRLPPAGLLAAAAATYVALRVLDDRADGDRSSFWADRDDSEAMIGVQVLLVTAAQVVGDGAGAPLAITLTRTYRQMLATVSDGQLRSGEPLTASTTPAEVHARIGSRSGALLAGFAELAALVALAVPERVAAGRSYGFELGVARQHANDLSELVSERTSDLRNRTATMVTALALQTASPSDRAALLLGLDSAADDREERDRLVRELAPVMREVVALTALHLARARTQARLLCAGDLRHDELERLVDATDATLRRRPSSAGGLSS